MVPSFISPSHARGWRPLVPLFKRRGRISAILSCLALTACGSPKPGTEVPEGVAAANAPTKGAPELILTPQLSGTEALLQAVSPVDDDVVWVSGHQGTWAISVDGGTHWDASVMEGEEDLQFRDVAAFDSRTAYLMSTGTGPQSRIYRTDDGGESWRLQYRAENPDAFLDCMGFWDRDRGLVYGDAVDGVPFILSTTDGGGHWERVPESGLPVALEGEGGFAASGTCVAVGEGGRAWIGTGAGPRPRVLRTEDRGGSWTAVDVPVVGGGSSGLFTLHVGLDGWGIALGGTVGGDTLRTDNVVLTEDLGESWGPGGHPAILGPIYGSAVVDLGGARGVVAVGPKGLDWSGDGGLHWTTADTLTYWAAAFASPSVGWAVGPQGRITKLSFR